MGFHVNILEPGWSTTELLSLYTLPSQPPPFRIPLESICSRLSLRHLSFHVLDLGHREQPKEQIPPAGTRHFGREEHLPSITMADCQKPPVHQNFNW